MNVGRRVELVDLEGARFKGTMTGFTGDSLTLELNSRAKGKKKEMAEKEFSLQHVRSVKVLITFKQ